MLSQSYPQQNAPYSLGKLIDWKLKVNRAGGKRLFSPYSLGKLIDWKLKELLQIFKTSIYVSLLAREIN